MSEGPQRISLGRPGKGKPAHLFEIFWAQPWQGMGLRFEIVDEMHR